jgi:LysR family transcriptional regulator, nitrogen assimilation regulatory protein
MADKHEPALDLGRLTLFVQVAHEGSLTRVAASTGSPQPVISRRIAKLEEDCGGRLFLRTGRGVTLTELGERLLPRAQAVLREADELTSELSASAQSPSGQVRIGTLPSLHLSLVVPLLAVQLRDFPKVRLHVREGSSGQIDQWLVNGTVDIGIGYRYGRATAGDAERLLRVGSFLLGPPGDPLTQGKTIAFQRLDGIPLVLPSAPSAVRLLLDQLARRARIRLNVIMEADSTQIQKAAAAHVGAYTVMPTHAAREELDSGRLQGARIVEPRIDRDIALAMTSARPASQATREIARLIRSFLTGDQAQRLFADP